MRFVNNTPSFLIINAENFGCLNIYQNGVLYAQIDHDPGNFKINLPFPGYYELRGEKPGQYKFGQPHPLTFKEPGFRPPKPERDRNLQLNHVFFDNSKPYTPAAIDTLQGVVKVSRKFFKYPVEIRYFILLHEIGHFFYKTEWKCDQFAAYYFLKSGLNKTSAFNSLADVLHMENHDGSPNQTNQNRVNKIYKLLYP